MNESSPEGEDGENHPQPSKEPEQEDPNKNSREGTLKIKLKESTNSLQRGKRHIKMPTLAHCQECTDD